MDRSFICSFFIFLPLWVFSIPLSISFQQLQEDPKQWEGKEISIRGFLYQKEDGSFIISSLPHLKSCCLDHDSIRRQQLILEKYKDPFITNRVVELVGLLKTESVKNQAGSINERYLLTEPRLANLQSLNIPWGTIGMTCIGIGWVSRRWLKARRKHGS